MPSTTRFDRGSVVLVPFLFTDQSRAKRRPAVVISVAEYHKRRNKVILAAITSNTQRRLLPGDFLLQEWQAAGLLVPSVATGIVQTVRREQIERVLGSLTAADSTSLDRALSPMLGFAPV